MMNNNETNNGLQTTLSDVSKKDERPPCYDIEKLIESLYIAKEKLLIRIKHTYIYFKESQKNNDFEIYDNLGYGSHPKKFPYWLNKAYDVNCLQDIEYLPMTIINTYYPINLFLPYYGRELSVPQDRDKTLLFLTKEKPSMQSEEENADKSDWLDLMFNIISQISDEQLESFLSDYIIKKRGFLTKIENFLHLDTNERIEYVEEKKEWLLKFKKEILTGSLDVQESNPFFPSALHFFVNNPRFNLIINKLSVGKVIIKYTDQIDYSKYISTLEHLIEEHDKLLKNFEDIIAINPFNNKIYFNGIAKIKKEGFDMSKVSITVISNAEVPLDMEMIKRNYYEAKKIKVRYEGVDNATTLDLFEFNKEDFKIHERERKLLLALAFLGKNKESNQKEIETLLSEASDDSVSLLNGMLRVIFDTKKGVKFIDKSKGCLNFKIGLESIRELYRF